MNSITYSMFGFSNWCVKTIIAQTFEPGYYDKGGAICQLEKFHRPGEEKGG